MNPAEVFEKEITQVPQWQARENLDRYELAYEQLRNAVDKATLELCEPNLNQNKLREKEEVIFMLLKSMDRYRVLISMASGFLEAVADN
jgi:hypothetical protein